MDRVETRSPREAGRSDALDGDVALPVHHLRSPRFPRPGAARCGEDGRAVMTTSTAHRAELEIVAGSFLISFSGVFVKIAHVGPTAAGVYRNLFGAIALFGIALVRRDSFWRGWDNLRWVLLGGAAF